MGEKRLLAYLLCVITVTEMQCHSIEKFPLLMPNVRPNKKDQYLCTSMKLDTLQSYYIVGFEPNATMHIAHHIIIHGCLIPGSAKPLWVCDEMAGARYQGDEDTGTPCQKEHQFIYAWARDAPKLVLPDAVGFKVGAGSSIKHLVLQVHYAHIDHFEDGSTDDSGVFLHYTRQPMKKLAAVISLVAGGAIPPRSTEHLEAACSLDENKTIHPFAYRTHTHDLGKVVSGYLIKPGNQQWIELGKRDPLTPQMFYPVHNETPAVMGDKLAARCTMVSDRDTWTFFGPTNDDEMCLFYLMYWVENEEPLDKKKCISRGPPSYYWRNDGLTNIPEAAASSLTAGAGISTQYRISWFFFLFFIFDGISNM